MRLSRWLSVKALAAGLLVAGFLALIPTLEAAPLTRVRVEVTIHGAAAIAAHIRQRLPGKLKAALAQTPVEAGPLGTTLLVRIHEIYLSHDGGEPFPRFGTSGFAMPDSMRGEVLLVDGRGRTLSRRPLTANSPANSAGGIMNPHAEPIRVEKLMEAFAYWAVRGLE